MVEVARCDREVLGKVRCDLSTLLFHLNCHPSVSCRCCCTRLSFLDLTRLLGVSVRIQRDLCLLQAQHVSKLSHHLLLGQRSTSIPKCDLQLMVDKQHPY